MGHAPVAEPAGDPTLRGKEQPKPLCEAQRRSARRNAAAVDHEDALQFRGAAPERDCITGRGPFLDGCAKNRSCRTLLVREREHDYEGDHNKGDRISVKSFPIDVNTHRTALLFAEVTARQ